MKNRLLTFIALVTLLWLGPSQLPSAVAYTTVTDGPEWIWAEDASTASLRLERNFTLDKRPLEANAWILVDYGEGTLIVNGTAIALVEAYDGPRRIDVSELLHTGENVVRFEGQGLPGPTAFALRLEAELADQSKAIITTDRTWRCDSLLDISSETTDDSPGRVTSFGPVATWLWSPQRSSIAVAATEDYGQWKRALATDHESNPATFDVPDGFVVEQIRAALPGEDSWISLAQDPQGRWVIGQEKQGLLRLEIRDDGETTLEQVESTLHECRGLTFIGEDLYAAANNDKAVFRVPLSSDGDRFSTPIKLLDFPGDVGHGRNQLTVTQDGYLYLICGDAVFEPDDSESLVPQGRRPNEIERTRSGFVARIEVKDLEEAESPEPSQWEVVARGLRNPYGIAMNEHHDLFTYDADAEFDMGASWYRPTRVVHVQPGADYGWRRVTGRWPAYFPDRPDTPKPLLDIGKGSPTAVVFGEESRFPEPLQKSLFILDWAYGRILSVELEPRGAGYLAVPRLFLQGRPLNICDAKFGRDGWMYFVTGGRGTRSALYRVRYTGAQQSSPALTKQQLRRKRDTDRARQDLTKLQGAFGLTTESPQQRLELLWPFLNSHDPWLRHTAIRVLESIDVAVWRERTNESDSPRTRLALQLALRNVGTDSDLNHLILQLESTEPDELPLAQQREFVFLIGSLLEAPSIAPSAKTKLMGQLLDLLPSQDAGVHQQISQLLGDLESLSEALLRPLVKACFQLLSVSSDAQSTFHNLYALRNTSHIWTNDQLDLYLDRYDLVAAQAFGEGMPGFLSKIREAVSSNLRREQRILFANHFDVASKKPTTLPDSDSKPRELIRAWSLNDFEALQAQTHVGDPAKGKQIFETARCATCHRMEGRGGVLGPDLSSLARRFGSREVWQAIVSPSSVIAPKYQADIFELDDGSTISGRLIPGDYRAEVLVVRTNLLDPSSDVEFSKSSIVAREASDVSPMPAGLLDTFSATEIADLMAYLKTPLPRASE